MATTLTYPLNVATATPTDDRVVPTVMLSILGPASDIAASTAVFTFKFDKGTFAEAILPTALTCVTTGDSFGTTTACSTPNISIVSGGAKGESEVAFQASTPAVSTGAADGLRMTLTVPKLTATGAVTVSSSIATSTGDLPPVVECIKDDATTKTVDESKMCSIVVKTAEAVSASGIGGGTQAHIDLDDFSMLAKKDDGKAREGVSLGKYTFNVDNNKGKTLGPDGTALNEDAAATLTITVAGDLNEGDTIKVGGVDPKDLTVGTSPEVSTLVTLSSAEPGLTELKSSKEVSVTYMPAGKAQLSHGAEIDVMFTPRFTRVENTAIDDEEHTTMLKLSGVESEVKAYALPFEGNGKNDKANVRIRCEDGVRKDDKNDCRVFIECWNDMGEGGIGEVGKIAEGSLEKLDTMGIETMSGVDQDDSRLSCRVLATGTVTVQALVRDGTTGTLVNNTAVGRN